MARRLSISSARNCIGLLLGLLVLCCGRPAAAQYIYAGPYGEGSAWNVYEVFGLGLELNNPRWRVAAQTPKTWREAEQLARARTETISGQGLRGHLAALAGPGALAENAFLASLPPVSEGGAWIGLTDSELFGGGETASSPQRVPSVDGLKGLNGPPGDGLGWKWTNGEVFDTTNWVPPPIGAQPDNSTSSGPGEDAVFLRGNGFWEDLNDSSPRRAWIVEYDTRLPQEPELPESLRSTPGPRGGAGTFGVREVALNGQLHHLNDAITSLLNPGPNAVVRDYHAPTINMRDSGWEGSFGNDRQFEVVQQGDLTVATAEHIALTAHGRIRIPEGQGGEWRFYVNSDDGFELWLPGQRFRNMQGSPNGPDISFYGSLRYREARSPETTSAAVDLAPGDYDLELVYFEEAVQGSVELYAGRGDEPPVLIGAPAVHISGTTPHLAGDFQLKAIYRAPDHPDLIDNLAEARAVMMAPSVDDVVVESTSPTVNFTDQDHVGASRGLFAGDALFPGAQPGSSTEPNDENFVFSATATLIVESAGTYTFGFSADEGGALTIAGADLHAVFGNVDESGETVFCDDWFMTKCTASVVLDAGEYALEFVSYDNSLRTNQAFAEIFVSPGDYDGVDPSAFALLSPTATAIDFSRAQGLQLVSASATVAGDTNGDGEVNLEDLNNVRNNFGNAGLGDTNNDGVVDLVDLNNVRNFFGTTAPQSVPEPATTVIACVAFATAAFAVRTSKRLVRQ